MNNQFNYATFVGLFLNIGEEQKTGAVTQHPAPTSAAAEPARPDPPVSPPG